jgi:hypothetical protein
MMKYSALSSGEAGLALDGVRLPGTALAEKRTPFTATQHPGWLASVTDSEEYVFNRESTLFMDFMDSTESRVAGSGSYSMCAVDLKTDAPTYWGELRISNEDGAWKGFWTGDKAGFTAILVGSGEYEGLVSRWSAPFPEGDCIEWSGYIVENGPGEVPFTISGWRIEKPDFSWLPFAKATLETGGGQASHIGVFTDLKETGLMMMTRPTTGISRGMGIAEAANGDLFTWVSFGEMKSEEEFEFQVFFAGGTGRFEHAVGSYAGQVKWTSQTSCTCNGTYNGVGTIRY